jgi:hypothetical protein
MLFPGKILLAGTALLLVFGFSNGLLHWNHDKVKCFQKRDWTHGDWHTWFAVGKLEFRVKDFGCDPIWKLDPDQFQKDAAGQITPRELTE